MAIQVQPRVSRSINVGPLERAISLFAGAGMLSYLVMNRPRMSVPLGLSAGYMVYRGASGHCLTYQALGISRAKENGKDGIYVQRSITVNRPRDQLYRIWRNFENLPRFMKHLESVQVDKSGDGKITHWKVKAPLGRDIEWDSEVVDDRVNETLAWRSLPGASVESMGRVDFMDAPAGRGTIIHVAMQYNPPGGSIGAAFAKIFGEEPSVQVRDDLRAFKQMMEAGEIATVEGQPSGRDNDQWWGLKTMPPKKPRKDEVERASEDSFPASDPPGWISKTE